MKNISNAEVLKRTEILAAEERKITAELLLNLRQVELRRLYAELGFSSLFEFTVKHLKYSEGAASRRIAAMRALRDCGEIHESSGALDAVKEGRVSVSSLSALQTFFKEKERQDRQPLAKSEKIEWMKKVQGKASRECERLFAETLPEGLPRKDSTRAIGCSRTELAFSIGPETLQKLKRARALLSHRLRDSSYEALLSAMADLVISRLDPRESISSKGIQAKEAKADGNSETGSAIGSNPGSKPKADETRDESHSAGPSPQRDLPNPPRKFLPNAARRTATPAPGLGTRFIPKEVIREVWKRDQGRCTFQSPTTSRFCGSSRFLQLDHIHPHALGGPNTVENLRLRCAAHNLLSATQLFGEYTQGSAGCS